MRTLGPPDHADHEPVFAPLRAVAAELLIVTGAGAALQAYRRRDPEPVERPLGFPLPVAAATDAAAWAPSVVAPLAAAAHLIHASRPSEDTHTATRFLDMAVIGLGVAATFADLLTARDRRNPGLAPLALASAGLVGLLVQNQERAAARERRHLQRRASIVERIVPRRRPKFDRVVVHV